MQSRFNECVMMWQNIINEQYYFDNNFMKVTKERNPYLRRISSDAPHKYSYQNCYLDIKWTQESIFCLPKMVPKDPLTKLEHFSHDSEKTSLDSPLLISDMKPPKKMIQLCITLPTLHFTNRTHIIHLSPENLLATCRCHTKSKVEKCLNFSRIQMNLINLKINLHKRQWKNLNLNKNKK